MSTETKIPRKRKPTEESEVVVSNSDDVQSKKRSKARRVSTDTPALTVTSHQTTKESPNPDSSLECIGALIQDLFHSDNAKVNDALDALNLDLDEDERNCESLVTAGGCHALVQLLNNYLDKVMGGIPFFHQVAELDELAEVMILYKTLNFIINH